jgi:predicted DsbA family dithiol-disulfide isomerase
VRIERLRKDFNIQIEWVAFPFHPEIPEEGLPLEQLFAGRGVDRASVTLRLKKVAGELGLPLGERMMTYNSRLAQELAKWAEARGKGDEFHDAVFLAYFAEGKNIGKMDELAEIAASLGLPEEEANAVLISRTFREEVDSDWSRARELGITAVPTFVINGQAVVGAQPYEVLETFLRDNHGRKRARTIV